MQSSFAGNGDDGCVCGRKETHSSFSLLFHAEEIAGTITGRRILGWKQLVGTGAGRAGEQHQQPPEDQNMRLGFCFWTLEYDAKKMRRDA